jgi:hypothetical protein
MPIDDRHARRLEPLLGAATVALAALAASTFLIAAPRRLAFPYEIEWLESEILQHVARLLEGKGLFTAPSAEFAPTIYPPLYAFASTLAARGLGLGFLAPRLVSALAALATALLAAAVARRLGGSRRGAYLAACLCLATYVPCGTVLDLARLDSLWVLLLLAGAAAAERAGEGVRRAALAGLLLALASATKQPAALLPLVLGVLLWRSSRRPAAVLLGVWAGLTALYYGSLHLATGGWSTFYLVAVPLRVPRRPAAFLHLLRDDLLATFAPAAAVLLLWGLRPRAAPLGGPLPATWWAALGVAGAMTAATRTLQGGAENTLAPLAVFGAVLVASVAGRVLRHGSPPLRLALLVALGLQLLRLVYSPASLVPGRADRERAAAFVARLRELPGAVWVPSHTSYAHLAGKPFLVHRDPLLDLHYAATEVFPDDLLAALRRGAFGAVVVDAPFAETRLQQALEEGYAPAEAVTDPPVPRVGYRTWPARVYRPRGGGDRLPSGTGP